MTFYEKSDRNVLLCPSTNTITSLDEPSGILSVEKSAILVVRDRIRYTIANLKVMVVYGR